MNERQLARWERARAGGKWRYVWLYGVLGWGLSTWVLVQLISLVWDYLDHTLEWGSFGRQAVGGLVLWPLAGILWGLWEWSTTLKQYNKR